jgi:hypothetical protein
VGLRNKAPNFKYTITVKKQDGSGNASICATSESYLSDVKKIFRRKDYTVFQHDYWKRSVDTENHLTYEVETVKDVKE